MQVFFARTGAERPLSMDWCRASLALAWSYKNGEAFRIGRNGISLIYGNGFRLGIYLCITGYKFMHMNINKYMHIFMHMHIFTHMHISMHMHIFMLYI